MVGAKSPDPPFRNTNKEEIEATEKRFWSPADEDAVLSCSDSFAILLTRQHQWEEQRAVTPGDWESSAPQGFRHSFKS